MDARVAAKGNLEFRTPDGGVGTMQSLKRFGSWPELRDQAARRGWTEVRGKGKPATLPARDRKTATSRPPLLWPVLDYSRVPEAIEELQQRLSDREALGVEPRPDSPVESA